MRVVGYLYRTKDWSSVSIHTPPTWSTKRSHPIHTHRLDTCRTYKGQMWADLLKYLTVIFPRSSKLEILILMALTTESLKKTSTATWNQWEIWADQLIRRWWNCKREARITPTTSRVQWLRARSRSQKLRFTRNYSQTEEVTWSIPTTTSMHWSKKSMTSGGTERRSLKKCQTCFPKTTRLRDGQVQSTDPAELAYE